MKLKKHSTTLQHEKNADWVDGYKVVRIFWDGRMASSAVNRFLGGIIYQEGTIIVPKEGCGPICVFKRLKDALRFKTQPEEIIMRCKFLPSKKKSVWVKGDAWCIKQRLCELARGTVLADAVKLLGKVRKKIKK